MQDHVHSDSCNHDHAHDHVEVKTADETPSWVNAESVSPESLKAMLKETRRVERNRRKARSHHPFVGQLTQPGYVPRNRTIAREMSRRQAAQMRRLNRLGSEPVKPASYLGPRGALNAAFIRVEQLSRFELNGGDTLRKRPVTGHDNG